MLDLHLRPPSSIQSSHPDGFFVNLFGPLKSMSGTLGIGPY
jgi:hypothetical protein